MSGSALRRLHPYPTTRTIFVASIQSRLRCFALRFTRRLAGSSATASTDISSSSQRASQNPA